MTSTNNNEKPDIFMELSVQHMRQIIELLDNGEKKDLKAIIIKI